MKLRLRQAGVTHRIEVPELCDLRRLRERVATVLEIPVADVRLSLNKHDDLAGPPGTILSSFGIRSGDLLYFLPGPQRCSRPGVAHLHARSVEGPRAVQGGAQAYHTTIATSSLWHAQPESQGTEVVGQVHGLSAANEAQVRRERCASAASSRVQNQTKVKPDVDLLSSQAPSGSLSQQTGKAPEEDPSNGTSEPSNPYSNVKDGVAPEDDLLGQMKPMEVDAPRPEEKNTPRTSPDLPSILQRALDAEGQAIRGIRRADLLAVAVHAVMLETGLTLVVPEDAASGASTLTQQCALPKGWQLAKTSVQLRYALPVPCPVACMLHFQTVGDHMVVYGRMTGPQVLRAGGGIYRVSLSVQSHCGEQVGNDSKDLSKLFLNLRLLWKDVKDNLSVPLFSALCRQAGLEVPPSLMVLPTEVKNQILERLSAASLAACACVCSELRFLSNQDELWRVLYKLELRSIAGDRPPGGGSWKSAFANAVQEKRQEEARQREVEARARLMAQQIRPVPRQPFYPAPGIIGGDYDRFPALGGGGIVGGIGGPGPFPGRGGFTGGGAYYPLGPEHLADPTCPGVDGSGYLEGLGIRGPPRAGALAAAGELPALTFLPARMPGSGPGLGGSRASQIPRFSGGDLM